MYTRPTTSQQPLEGLHYTIGRLETKDAEQDRRITKLEEHREKDKAETDKLKTWAERGAFLVLIYAINAGLFMSAPVVAPIIGAMVRAMTSGLRGG